MRKLLLLAVLLVTLLPTIAQATGNRRFARQRVVVRQPVQRQVFVQPRRQVFVQRQLIHAQPVFVQPLLAPQLQLRQFDAFGRSQLIIVH